MAKSRSSRERGSFWDRQSSDSEPSESTPSEDSGAWTYAPATSHITRFKFSDARDVSLLRNFGHGATQEGGVRRSEGASELHVVFRDEKKGGEKTRYVYWFSDHAAGRAVFDRLASSEHPYGHVLYPDVIVTKVPCKELPLPS